jgi:phage terminase small subunit
MPPLDNPQYERFALLLARGTPEGQAYVRVGFKTDRGNAYKLSKKPEVALRIRELQEGQRARLGITVEHGIAELNAAYRLARKTRQPASMVAATMSKMKLLGLVVDKAEVEGTIRRPMREPGDAKPMTMEEWQEKFAPGSAPANVVELPRKDSA